MHLHLTMLGLKFFFIIHLLSNIPATIFSIVYEFAQESVNVPASLSVFNADIFYTYMLSALTVRCSETLAIFNGSSKGY